MNCNEFKLALVGDDPAEREPLEHHASGCCACSVLLQKDRGLAEAVEEWRAATPGPPLTLERKIAAALMASRAAAPVGQAITRAAS